jgi:predicted phosphoribosyltransferase
MKKVIFNISFITVMALPCGYMFVDSGFFQAMGVAYTVFYVKDIIFPLYKRLASLGSL